MRKKLKTTLITLGLSVAIISSVKAQTSAWTATVSPGTLNTITTSPSGASTRVSIAGTNAAPSSGTLLGGALSVGSNATGLALQSGVYATGITSTSYGWMQARYEPSGTTYYTLKLNPLGGDVNTGGALSVGAALNVGSGLTVNNNIGLGGDIRVNDNHKIYLRSGTDINHGLFWDATVDGPKLFGYSGGALSTANSGVYNNQLTWTSTGFVNIANNFEVGPVAVRSATIMAQIWAGSPGGSDKVGLYLTTRHTADYGYGMKVDVDRNYTKALSVYNSTGSTENFIVFGDGAVFAREVKIMTGTFAHPDYVFEKNYKLLPLSELETYLSSNKHLPNVPSALEVKKNEGINLGEMSEKQLEKIEELTLYIIELNKKIEAQDKRLAELEKSK